MSYATAVAQGKHKADEQQQQQKSGSSRRILPLPGGSFRKDPYESEAARNVRLLLARQHTFQSVQANSNQQQNKEPAKQKMNAPYLVPDNNNESLDETDLHFSSALPGDSFPDTARQLLGNDQEHPDDDEEVDEDEEVLLQRLQQSQARMEQIKRMLVNQRGFIVQSLRQMAENTARNVENSQKGTCSKCSSKLDVPGNDERDRTLGSTVRHTPERVEAKRGDNIEVERVDNIEDQDHRLCPMCEAAFTPEVSEEAFEQHVIEHFSFTEEPDTIKYVGPDNK